MAREVREGSGHVEKCTIRIAHSQRGFGLPVTSFNQNSLSAPTIPLLSSNVHQLTTFPVGTIGFRSTDSESGPTKTESWQPSCEENTAKPRKPCPKPLRSRVVVKVRRLDQVEVQKREHHPSLLAAVEDRSVLGITILKRLVVIPRPTRGPCRDCPVIEIPLEN